MFAWKDDYSVSVAAIDNQHRRLFQLAQDLHEAMLARSGKQLLAGTLDNLIAYTKTHFASEERLMEERRYPDYRAHKAEHETLTQTVLQFQKDFLAGKVALSVHLMQFLKDWLQRHIVQTDKKFGLYLSEP